MRSFLVIMTYITINKVIWKKIVGGENIGVADFMIRYKGINGMRTGKSVSMVLAAECCIWLLSLFP